MPSVARHAPRARARLPPRLHARSRTSSATQAAHRAVGDERRPLHQPVDALEHPLEQFLGGPSSASFVDDRPSASTPNQTSTRPSTPAPERVERIAERCRRPEQRPDTSGRPDSRAGSSPRGRRPAATRLARLEPLRPLRSSSPGRTGRAAARRRRESPTTAPGTIACRGGGTGAGARSVAAGATAATWRVTACVCPRLAAAGRARQDRRQHVRIGDGSRRGRRDVVHVQGDQARERERVNDDRGRERTADRLPAGRGRRRCASGSGRRHRGVRSVAFRHVGIIPVCRSKRRRPDEASGRRRRSGRGDPVSASSPSEQPPRHPVVTAESGSSRGRCTSSCRPSPA